MIISIKIKNKKELNVKFGKKIISLSVTTSLHYLTNANTEITTQN